MIDLCRYSNFFNCYTTQNLHVNISRSITIKIICCLKLIEYILHVYRNWFTHNFSFDYFSRYEKKIDFAAAKKIQISRLTIQDSLKHFLSETFDQQCYAYTFICIYIWKGFIEKILLLYFQQYLFVIYYILMILCESSHIYF